MKKNVIASKLRSRTILVASTKGGVGKTSLTASLAYEFARLGLRVLLVDADGTGGVSSICGAYAPEGSPSVTEVIEGSSGLVMYPVDRWQPDEKLPWIKGGPAVPGGRILILPAAESTAGRTTVSTIVSQGGTVAESRLAVALDNPQLKEQVDVILVDMPGTDNPAVISTMLHAAEHVVFPFYPEYFAFEGIRGTDTAIDRWFSTTGKPVNYVGGVPLCIPTHLGKSSTEREVLDQYQEWLHEASEGTVHMLAPGIESRKAVPRAIAQSLPPSLLTSTKIERRNMGTIPAALTKTALTMLESMRPDPEDADTNDRVNYDVEGMAKAVLAQEMPQDWRNIIEGPKYFNIDDSEAE